MNWELKSVCLNLRPRRADYVMHHQWEVCGSGIASNELLKKI